jgi:hypothetical protein
MGTEKPIDARKAIDDRFREEVNEANILLEWAVATGQNFSPELVDQIKEGYSILNKPGEEALQARKQFESAYHELAQATLPVTAATLIATDDAQGRTTWLLLIHKLSGKTVSEGRIWSRKLWLWTILYALAVMMAANFNEYLDLFAPADSQSIEGSDSILPYHRVSFWLAVILPFLYGGLGSCAYLLRSCHKFLYRRTFDPHRIPEYYSQMMLGFVAGGTILLFMTEGGSLLGSDTPLSAAALAFLAGYSTDFLYTALERIAEAVLPKKRAPDA